MTLSKTVRVDGRDSGAWSACREDLGLNPDGDAVEGVEEVLVEESEDGYYVEAVEIRFESADALNQARDRLREKATERFEWGDTTGAEDVQDFVGSLPTARELFND